ncbi:hypothetical protein AVEN_64238-1 [Araneus ventricosus]|uniref:Uncharacterized protein n=1 Tax=Araneus ventricosus TaxID=182803 RepID=A0A4Y2J8J8_ARAVE|nr:hypothetical protein AVEN_64238-1 [Araneus ventricosus]
MASTPETKWRLRTWLFINKKPINLTPGLLHRFNLHPDPLCTVCNEINDISHILLKCKKYASLRVILWSKLNIVEPNITQDVLLSRAFTNKKHPIIFIQALKYFDIVQPHPFGIQRILYFCYLCVFFFSPSKTMKILLHGKIDTILFMDRSNNYYGIVFLERTIMCLSWN